MSAFHWVAPEPSVHARSPVLARGCARAVPAKRAPNSEAIAATVGGLKSRGKLLIVAAPFEPLTVSVFALFSGKAIQGWPSGSAIDSEETMAFSALTDVRPKVEVFKLEQAEEAFAKMMESRVRFRPVLTP